MGEPRIADDFAFISNRLKELEGDKPSPGGKWGVWYVSGKIWVHMRVGQTTTQPVGNHKISLYDTKDEAAAAIRASGDNEATREKLVPKPYLETLT
jgi:hypothetical protein